MSIMPRQIFFQDFFFHRIFPVLSFYFTITETLITPKYLAAYPKFNYTLSIISYEIIPGTAVGVRLCLRCAIQVCHGRDATTGGISTIQERLDHSHHYRARTGQDMSKRINVLSMSLLQANKNLKSKTNQS